MLLRLPGGVDCKKCEEEVAGVVGHGLGWGHHSGSTSTVLAL